MKEFSAQDKNALLQILQYYAGKVKEKEFGRLGSGQGIPENFGGVVHYMTSVQLFFILGIKMFYPSGN